MRTSFTGLYVIRADDGIISSVHVIDSDGNTIPLKPQDYLERGAKPPIEHLPDEKDFLAGQSSTHGFPT